MAEADPTIPVVYLNVGGVNGPMEFYMPLGDDVVGQYYEAMVANGEQCPATLGEIIDVHNLSTLFLSFGIETDSKAYKRIMSDYAAWYNRRVTDITACPVMGEQRLFSKAERMTNTFDDEKRPSIINGVADYNICDWMEYMRVASVNLVKLTHKEYAAFPEEDEDISIELQLFALMVLDFTLLAMRRYACPDEGAASLALGRLLRTVQGVEDRAIEFVKETMAHGRDVLCLSEVNKSMLKRISAMEGFSVHHGAAPGKQTTVILVPDAYGVVANISHVVYDKFSHICEGSVPKSEAVAAVVLECGVKIVAHHAKSEGFDSEYLLRAAADEYSDNVIVCMDANTVRFAPKKLKRSKLDTTAAALGLRPSTTKNTTYQRRTPYVAQRHKVGLLPNEEPKDVIYCGSAITMSSEGLFNTMQGAMIPGPMPSSQWAFDHAGVRALCTYHHA